MNNRNPNLNRVIHELRAAGVPAETPSPLRSGVHYRGYLPHIKREGASYFVTFRLADSLPQSALLEMKRQMAQRFLAGGASGKDASSTFDLEMQRQIERYLDRGEGACFLGNPEVAQMVQEALLYGHEKDYLLGDWVIMPNHVHLVLWPLPNRTLSDILHSRKLFTARRANLLLGRTGQAFWQRESYDHWIRDDDERARICRYIRNNPVTARLCSGPEQWRWSSLSVAQLA